MIVATMGVVMITVMMMIVVVCVTVAVTMVMRHVQAGRRIVAVQWGPRQSVRLAKLLITAGRIAITVAGTVFEPAANALHVMVVTFLRKAHLILKTQYLFSILAHLTIHQILPVFDLKDPVLKRTQHKVMIVEIGRLQKLDVRMARRHIVRERVNSFHQHAGEQKIGKDDDPPIAQLGRML